MDKNKTLKLIISNFDFLLFFLAIFCSILGIIAINSASYSLESHSRNLFMQISALLIGLIATALILMFDYDILGQLSKILYVANALLLLAVLLIGRVAHGTKGWINLGPFGFQPAELAKIIFIITFAWHISSVKDEINEPRNIFLLLLHLSVILGLILAQPDFGTSIVFIFIAFVMLFVSGISYKYIMSLVGIVLAAAPVLWFFVLKDYQRQRFLTFLYPENDPQGHGYQVMQSKIAIGSGQLLGKGYMQGTQTQMGYLPEKQTDFIFSVICEEFGFIGAAVVVLLLTLLILRCITCARSSRDTFGELMCTGVVAMLIFHTFENIGMCLGLMPVTGIPLPFFSYGGSNLIANLIAIALVLNVRLRRRFIFF